MDFVYIAGYRIFHPEFLGICGKCVFQDERWSIRIEVAKGRDAGSIGARPIPEVGNHRRFSPGHIGIRFRFILNGGSS